MFHYCSQLAFRVFVLHYMYRKGIQFLKRFGKKDKKKYLPNNVEPSLSDTDGWGFYDTNFY